MARPEAVVMWPQVATEMQEPQAQLVLPRRIVSYIIGVATIIGFILQAVIGVGVLGLGLYAIIRAFML